MRLALSAAFTLVFALAWGASSASAATSAGLDVDPTGNQANSLGSIDLCRSVAVDETFTVDVWAQDLPAITGFQAVLNYDPAVLELLSIDGNLILGALPGGVFLALDEPLPDGDGMYQMADVDLGDSATTQESGAGVLARVQFGARQSGVSGLALTGLMMLYIDSAGNILGAGDAGGDDYFDSPTGGGTIRVGSPCPGDPGDSDGDGVPDGTDNCPDTGNPGQGDKDGDSIGDWCDDGDADFLLDVYDWCPNGGIGGPGVDFNNDRDGDGLGDACDDDRDGDGLANASDNAPDVPNADQADMDGDTLPDAMDPDADGDGAPDKNYVTFAQADIDGDGSPEKVSPSRWLGIGDHVDVKFGGGLSGGAVTHEVYVGVAFLMTTIEVADLDGDGEPEVSIKDMGQAPGLKQQYDIYNDDPDSDIDIVVLGGGPLGRQAPPADVDGDGEAEARVWEPGLAPGQLIDTDLDGDGDPDVRWLNSQVSGMDNCPSLANATQGNQDAALAVAGASTMGDALGDDCDDDDDNDGFSDLVEIAIGTDSMDNCPGAPGAGGDAWPLDNNVTGSANVSDVLAYKGLMPGAVDPSHPKRLDIDDSGSLTVADALKFKGKLPSVCS